MRYAAVLFDLFDTLVRFDRERMPEIQINGKTVRSSAGMLHAILRTHAPHIELEACYEALSASWREAERLRALDHREVTAPVRFAHFFQTLGLDEAASFNPITPYGATKVWVERDVSRLADDRSPSCSAISA